MITTYQARRRQRIGADNREPGELIPEAHLWPVTDTLIDVGELVRALVPEEDFAEAVARYAPGDTEPIYAAVGLRPFDEDNGAADRPKGYKGRAARGKPPVPVGEPEPLDT